MHLVWFAERIRNLDAHRHMSKCSFYFWLSFSIRLQLHVQRRYTISEMIELELIQLVVDLDLYGARKKSFKQTSKWNENEEKQITCMITVELNNKKRTDNIMQNCKLQIFQSKCASEKATNWRNWNVSIEAQIDPISEILFMFKNTHVSISNTV